MLQPLVCAAVQACRSHCSSSALLIAASPIQGMALRARRRRAMHRILRGKLARRRAHIPWRLRLARDVGDIAERYTNEGVAFEEEVLDAIAREASRRADTVRLRTILARDPYGELSPGLARALARRIRCEAPRDCVLARESQRVETVLVLKPSGGRLRLVYEASGGELRWCVELEAQRLLQLDVLTDESESSSLFIHRKLHRHLGRALALSLARHEALFFLLSLTSTYDNAHGVDDKILEQLGVFDSDEDDEE